MVNLEDDTKMFFCGDDSEPIVFACANIRKPVISKYKEELSFTRSEGREEAYVMLTL